MDKVLISNSQGESGIVNVIRYFINNGTEYLIYSLNEVDESGYTRLYVTKLNGANGVYNADTLNENEWVDIKNLVKTIVKANKEGLPLPIQDLNPKKINNIILKDKKVFKLNAPLVNDLGSNKPTFGNTEPQNIQTPNPFATPTEPVFNGSAPFDVPAPDVQGNVFNGPTTQPTFDTQNNNMFNTPVQPAFENPINTNMNVFNGPSAFDMPTPPVQPTFETPTQQPFSIPSTPTFESTPTPSFDVQTPVQQSFDMPQTFEVPTTPVQPTFETPTTQSFEMPSVNMFAQEPETTSVPSYNFGTDFQTPINNNVENYQSLYNSELEKNQNLQNEVNKLNEELTKYKNMISNLKEIIEK